MRCFDRETKKVYDYFFDSDLGFDDVDKILENSINVAPFWVRKNYIESHLSGSEGLVNLESIEREENEYEKLNGKELVLLRDVLNDSVLYFVGEAYFNENFEDIEDYGKFLQEKFNSSRIERETFAVEVNKRVSKILTQIEKEISEERDEEYIIISMFEFEGENSKKFRKAVKKEVENYLKEIKLSYCSDRYGTLIVSYKRMGATPDGRGGFLYVPW